MKVFLSVQLLLNALIIFLGAYMFTALSDKHVARYVLMVGLISSLLTIFQLIVVYKRKI
jgi:hypothetical protein